MVGTEESSLLKHKKRPRSCSKYHYTILESMDARLVIKKKLRLQQKNRTSYGSGRMNMVRRGQQENERGQN